MSDSAAHDPPGSCALSEMQGTAACPVDPCAACSSVAEGLECCVERHGLARDPGCGAGAWLSAGAARCAAQVYGLPAGLDTCTAELAQCDSEPAWTVTSLSAEGCGWWEYDGVLLDARTGELQASLRQYVDGVCGR